MNHAGNTDNWLIPISVSHIKSSIFVQAEKKKKHILHIMQENLCVHEQI